VARLIATHVTGPVVLAAADNPLMITGTGAVTSSGAGVDGVDGDAATNWTISNDGTVNSGGGVGIRLAGNGRDSNGLFSGTLAVIAGSTVGVGIYGKTASVTNTGRISGNVGTLLNAG
jgi:hypothetical protein